MQDVYDKNNIRKYNTNCPRLSHFEIKFISKIKAKHISVINVGY